MARDILIGQDMKLAHVAGLGAVLMVRNPYGAWRVSNFDYTRSEIARLLLLMRKRAGWVRFGATDSHGF